MSRLVYNCSVGTVVNLVNEPSVALFRIQEHIRKSAPEIVEERRKAFVCAEKLQGISFDLDNTLDVISAFPKLESNLTHLLETLDACIVHRQYLQASQQNRLVSCLVFSCVQFFVLVLMYSKRDDFELGVDVVALLATDF
ncbi:unnamed protein product [Hydatigera taeniaeformis]|uniref:BLOC-1-related complex subunit 7 n=1 Tax=Hydatigena taeniaeformis TaxID=6205 RepID=A0A0R3XB29_HYDTA|nr:unnamed protein product [Hydatigera taeniaeformis]